MTTSDNFDFFLKNGFLKGLEPETSLKILLSLYGEDNWYVKEIENNGLIYGIIKVGITEFHIYNEKLSGISYRPDIRYEELEYKNDIKPWVIDKNNLEDIELILKAKRIEYKKYLVDGPVNNFKTAGAQLIGLNKGKHLIIDTIGGVTFLFNDNEESDGDSPVQKTYQICKYYTTNNINVD